MYPVLSFNRYGIVSKNIETADIFLVSVCIVVAAILDADNEDAK